MESGIAIEAYDAERTALLIVDPYDGFMSESGKLHNAIEGTADASGVFSNMHELIRSARSAGMQVFVMPQPRAEPDQQDYDDWLHINALQKANVPFAFGSLDGEFDSEFGPLTGDAIIETNRAQNGFANANLDLQLKRDGIQRIIVVGLIANRCVESTARAAMERGYHVTLVNAATTTFDPAATAAAEANVPMFAHAVLTTKALRGLLAPSPARPN